jgi:hypothetical protein
MSELSAFDAAAPFIVGVLLALLVMGATKLVEKRVEAIVATQVGATKVGVPGFAQPAAQAEIASWAADATQAVAVIVAPATGLVLLHADLGAGAWVAYVGVIVAGFLLFVAMMLTRPDKYARRSLGWFSPLTIVGIVLNLIAAAVAAVTA